MNKELKNKLAFNKSNFSVLFPIIKNHCFLKLFILYHKYLFSSN